MAIELVSNEYDQGVDVNQNLQTWSGSVNPSGYSDISEIDMLQLLKSLRNHWLIEAPSSECTVRSLKLEQAKGSDR